MDIVGYTFLVLTIALIVFYLFLRSSEKHSK